MRSIIAGIVPAPIHEEERSKVTELLEFEQLGVKRWNERTAGLPPDAPPLLPHGHYDLGIAIDGAFDAPSLSALRNMISLAVRNHSGWPPFLTVERPPFTPAAVQGAVEFWRGPDSDGSFDHPHHHDFWRVSPEGLFFTRSGYTEDAGFDKLPPGKFFDITRPTWRLGEGILEAFYIADAIGVGAEANLIVHASWTALSARKLISRGNPMRVMMESRSALQNDYQATKAVALSGLPAALPELVFEISRRCMSCSISGGYQNVWSKWSWPRSNDASSDSKGPALEAGLRTALGAHMW